MPELAYDTDDPYDSEYTYDGPEGEEVLGVPVLREALVFTPGLKQGLATANSQDF